MFCIKLQLIYFVRVIVAIMYHRILIKKKLFKKLYMKDTMEE